MLWKENKIDKKLRDRVRSVGSNAPRLYGLAKTHKEDVPLRPVLSMVGSSYYALSAQVAKWLSVLPESRINVSTEQIVKEIKNLKMAENEILISFDVSSLYTNVPVDESIKDAADMLYSGRCETPSVDKETFIELTKLAVKNIIMSTHDGYFMQVDGLAMGSPVSPLLANIWMSKFDLILKEKGVQLYKRYVDDIITIIDRNTVDEILAFLNGLHKNLKFTHECEDATGSIPFLDMKLHHDGENLTSSWYVKPSNSGLLLNYHALAPNKYKRAVIRSYVHRIFNSCSNWKYFHKGLAEAKCFLLNNQYPASFYEPVIHQTLEKIILK